MRLVFLSFLLFALMIACSDPKVRLVERQKEINARRKTLDRELDSIYETQFKAYVDGKLEVLNTFEETSGMQLELITLNKEYDSLEKELKKLLIGE
jgi:hypothetical protein